MNMSDVDRLHAAANGAGYHINGPTHPDNASEWSRVSGGDGPWGAFTAWCASQGVTPDNVRQMKLYSTLSEGRGDAIRVLVGPNREMYAAWRTQDDTTFVASSRSVDEVVGWLSR